VDRGVYNGSLDLEGGTIAVGTQPGQRWILTDGTLFNGTVNGVDGGELTMTGLLGKPRGTLRDLELNANVRIATDASLVVDGPLTGTGQLIVDGGLLSIGNRFDDSFSRVVIDRVTPIDGTVIPSLPQGLFWQMDRAPNSLSLSVFDGGPVGDFDFDGDVDGADYLKWQRNPGVGSLADWETHFGTVATFMASSTSVPEPSSLLLGVMACIVGVSDRRRSLSGCRSEMI